MKVRDLLKLLIDGQYIEFNYRDDRGYITAYDMELYRWDKDSNIENYPFLDREIEQVYSDCVEEYYDLTYDYLAVVFKGE